MGSAVGRVAEVVMTGVPSVVASISCIGKLTVRIGFFANSSNCCLFRCERILLVTLTVGSVEGRSGKATAV